MATSAEFMEYILDELSHINSLTTKKMFGEYAIYCCGVVVGLICDNTLFIKITPNNIALLEGKADKAPAYKGARDSYIIDDDIIADKDFIRTVFIKTMEDVMASKIKKPRKKKE